MKVSLLAALVAGTTLLSSGVYGAKKKKLQPAVPEMQAEQRVLHALNRLTFGPRPGDVEQAGRMGLDQWIERQLHPEQIPENPVLESKLEPLETLRMVSSDMIRRYPSDQMVRQMVAGRLPYPSDPATKVMIERAAARIQKKLAEAGSQEEAAPKLLRATLDPEQKQILETGKPAEQARMVAGMPEADQWNVLDSMPQGARQRLFNAAPPDLRRRIQMFNGAQQVVNQDLIEGKLFRAVYSNRQTEEVLTDFWYNHFNVFLDKGADRYMVTAYERDVIRPHVLGRFKDLLLATAQSPAMLFYLDNWQSVGPNSKMPARGKRRNGLNENYGRELMELHTLGVDGGYTQQDVTEVARCFTGWTIREPNRGGGFEFNARIHDNGEKTVLGVKIPGGGGMEDGLQVLDILAHHPSTARFVSRKLAIRFVSDNPPESLVQKMAATFTATDGDLREVMRTMLRAPEFWMPANFRSKVKSPLEMLTSAIRAVDGDVDHAFAVAGQLNQLGEPLYRKAEPTGYSNLSSEWMNSAALLARMNFAIALAQNRLPGVKVDVSRFSGDPLQIERAILSTDASREAKAAIDAGLEQRPGTPSQRPAPQGPLVAGLTLGSPDFQRR